MISIGLDLHVGKSYLTAINKETGEISNQGRIKNGREEFECYFGKFKGMEVQVVVEATTNTYPMVRLLRGFEGVSVKVVHPRKMKIIAESICKTDKLDSEVLALLGTYPYRLPESWIPDEEVHDLRSELRTRARLVAMRTELKNRVHGLLAGEGFFDRPKGLFGVRGREWLSQIELSEASRRRLDRFLRLLEEFDSELSSIERVIRDHYSRHPRWEEDVKILVTMPGIGVLTALTILSELGDWRRFRKARSVANYVGLVPRVDSSNEKHHYGRISKEGPRFLRWILAEVAHVSRRKVPRYEAKYQKIAFKKGGGVAAIAIARIMLCEAWVMLRDRKNFSYLNDKYGS